MGRIGATLNGFQLRLLDLHAQATAAANLNQLRLAAGTKFNAPRDGVSEFVALSGLESHRAQVTQATANVTAAAQLVSGAQLLLDQIRTQLNTVRAKAVADQDQQLTADQRTANQAAIDTAIAEIGRLVNTEVNGRRLLDGSADFQKSGINNAQVANLDIYAIGGDGSKAISGSVTSAATQATRIYTGAAGLINSGDAAFNLSGSRGSTSIAVTNGESLTAVRDRINAESHQTGVTASVAGDTLTFTSIDYGSRHRVDVSATTGTFTVAGSGVGSDATATINGRFLTGAGNRIDVNDHGFRFAVEIAGGFSGAFDAIAVSGSALRFSLGTDPGVSSTLAIPGLQPARLGGLSGTLDQLQTGGVHAGLGVNAPRAIRILDEALGKLTRMEGLVDGFAEAAIASASNLMASFSTNLTNAIDAINAVDETAEQLLQAKNEARASNALAALASLETQNQRVLALFQQIAGFNG